MEELIHYVWKHKLFPLGSLQTTKGEPLEVIDTGLHNDDSGPDFFNAKVKVGATLWVGNIEIHQKASEWTLHRHHQDPRYDNVVLHIVGEEDATAVTSKGRELPQLHLSIPQRVLENYQELIHEDRYPPCYRVVPTLSRMMIHGWMNALQAERLAQKTANIRTMLAECAGDWDAVYFNMTARSFGFGVNGDAFEAWSRAIPLLKVAHHRDNLFQIEAIFMGQAGLLAPESIPERLRQDALADPYYRQMRDEYAYLSHKFSLQPMDYKLWKFLRLRPQNFPYIRLSQLAKLYFSRQTGLDKLLDCAGLKDVRALFSTCTTPYWEAHYAFGVQSKAQTKRLSTASVDLLAINTAAPMLFAYGRHAQNERLCDASLSLLEQLKAEDNGVIRMWKACGLRAESALDSQALIQLKKQYCDKKDCLRCRIGYEYLRKGSTNNT